MINSLVALEKLLGCPPFDWQIRLLDRFLSGSLPSALDVPTGLGKTSLIAIWTLARAMNAPVPRRLVYVVDRRTVVDQATAEAQRIDELIASEADDLLQEIRNALGLTGDGRIAISMLRGQQRDNRAWLVDPSRPAIILGTVDMIGSRLLFEGYGTSRKMRPYHAGLLGQDTLVVLDEAHLVPAFTGLTTQIVDSASSLRPVSGLPPVRMIALSATLRSDATNTFGLETKDFENKIVLQRIKAIKRLVLHEPVSEPNLAEALATRAMSRATLNSRIVVFCNSRQVALDVQKRVTKTAPAQLLVGERRVREREALRAWIAEHGFLAGNEKRGDSPAFLIATSAGEVGIDLDADHMVGDLVAWERMVQRFGRVNRRGTGDAWIDIVPEVTKPPKEGQPPDVLAARRIACAELLGSLGLVSDGAGLNASPAALIALRNSASDAEIEAATTPAPLRPPLTPALLDAWSFTSLRDHPGRPEIGPWLRGWVDEDPQTTLIWRRYLPWRSSALSPLATEVADFFEAAGPQREEILEARPWDVLAMLKARAEKSGASVETPALLVLSPAGDLTGSFTIGALQKIKSDQAVRLFANRTIIVLAWLGGLSDVGLLDHAAGERPATLDGADGFGRALDLLVQEQPANALPEAGWIRAHTWVAEYDEEGAPRRLVVVDAPQPRPLDLALARRTQTLADHTEAVERTMREIAARLKLPDVWIETLAVAARLHDQGKRRAAWQDAMGTPRQGRPYAKSAAKGVDTALLDHYRHEFGSLAHSTEVEGFVALAPEWQELALHLVAAHHGGARPLIEARDPEAPPSVLQARASEVALRFVRLQRRWGPWGLAWWETLLRAADWRASADADQAPANS